MKLFVAFAALVAVAIATPLHRPVASELEELEAIVAAINSPSTDPATALLLQDLLAQIVGAGVGPALVEAVPPSVGPVLVDFPVHEPVDISPVVVAPAPEGAAKPLVQIIVNVVSSGLPAPIEVPAPEPVIIAPAPPPAPEPVEVAPAPVPAPEPVEIAPAPAPAPEPVEIAPAPAPVPQPPAIAPAPAPEQ